MAHASLGIALFAAALLAPIARAQAPLAWTGDGASATPALRRIGIPSSEAAGVSFAGEAGYAITEPVYSGDAEHHRAFGSIAGAVRPLDWLHVWLRADGRYDVHPTDATGPDDSLQGLPRAGLRLGGTLDPAFALGVDVELLVPGAGAPDVNAEALSLEARALAALRPIESVTLALLFGFRFDNGGATVPRPTPYRYGDIIALGINDYHALLTGVGVAWREDPIELFGELTLDVLIGDTPPGFDPPSFGVMPFRLSAGARIFALRGLSIEIGADVLMSAERPHIGPVKPLVAIEPRFTAYAALRFAMPFVEPVQDAVEAPVAEPEPVTPEPPPARGAIRGQIVDDQGRPLEGARVTLAPAEGAPLETTTDGEGSYAFAEVPIGSAALHAEAEGHDPIDRTLEVRAGENAIDPSSLVLAVPRGQLRGMIRSFDGRPLAATIRVEDLGVEAQTDAEGFFEIDVPPGAHVVTIEAERHRGQRREVEVPEHGVTVLNVDLRRGRRSP